MDDDLLRIWPRAERILDAILESPEPERSRRAEAACAGDPELRRIVFELLAAEREAGSYLSTPALAVLEEDPSAPEGALPVAGTRVGPYRLVSELGRGGMGVVYVAERDDGEFTQRVALKMLDAGTRTPVAIDRFRREREILARLHHPHVARLYDGGVTQDGAPFLVMELVEGRRIDEHCDAERLPVDARLRLFLQVCAAVEYAHGRLVVHRDLKPANVVVDSTGAVKLLDFGIARWLEESADPGAATATAARVMTPAYAAPEQFRGEPASVATDVYQLGLLLYELLCGHRAHGDAKSSPAVLIDAALQRDPLPPSRAATTGVTVHDGAALVERPADDLAARRDTSPDTLSRRLAGDLDAIVLKALRKAPAERYATVEALGRDVLGVLEFRPVEARKGSTAYRVRKTIRRHRVPFAAGAAASVSILVGVVGVLAQARVTAHERDRAQSAEARVSAINEFLVNELLRGATPEKARGRELTVAEVLGNASRAVGPALGAEPATEGDVRLALARSYIALGRYPEAREHAEAAAARFTRASEADRLRARRLLAELALLEGKIAEARQAADALVLDHARTLGDTHPETLRARLLAARVSNGEGKPAVAEPVLRGLMAVQARDLPDDWRLAVEIREALVDALTRSFRAVDAAARAAEAHEILRRRLGPDHPAAIDALRRLATAKSKLLLHQEALALHREVLALRERTAGPDHPDTADAWVDLSVGHSRLNQAAESAAAGRTALAIYQKALGPDHPRTIRALRNLAVLASQGGRHVEAEQAYVRVIDVRTRLLGELHPDTIGARRDLETLYVRAGRLAEARVLARTIVEAYGRATAPDDADPTMLDAFAGFLLTADPPDQRDPHHALALAERAVAATGRGEFLKLATLARAHRAVGDPERAIAAAREALDLPEAIRSWTTEALMVDLLREHRPPADLESFLLARITRTRDLRGDDEPLLAKTLRHLAHLYERAGRDAEAEQRFSECLAQLLKRTVESDWEVGRAKLELGAHLMRRGAFDAAEPLVAQGYATLAADPLVDAGLLETARKRLEDLRAARGPAAR